MSITILNDAQGRQLALQKIKSLSNELAEWRSDDEIRQIQRKKPKVGVFDFVKGLRLSAQLIYIIREHLSGYSLEANWGQVIDDSGTYLSPECDVIIHSPGQLRRWNGGENQVMDFKFIPREKVIAVISCKSKITSITKDLTDYCQRLKPYMRGKKIWLFAECVPKGKGRKIINDSKRAGYQKCWYLYNWDSKNSEIQRDDELLLDFIREIIKLGERKSRKGPR